MAAGRASARVWIKRAGTAFGLDQAFLGLAVAARSKLAAASTPDDR